MTRTRRARSTRLIAAAAALLLAAAVVPAVSQAEVTAGATAAQIAAAIGDEPGIVTGAEFLEQPSPSTAAVVTTPLAGFPSGGGSYGLLSTGEAADIELPNDSPNTGTDLGGAPVRGDSDRDVTVLRVDFVAPEGANCLIGLDFRFLSDEYPEYVGSAFNDAFIAELDESTWTTDGSQISAPGNFAFDPAGNEISINAAGATSVRPENSIGTTFDGATPLLRAATPLTPGPHSLYLSLFDQGDAILDSAVQIDNLRVGTVADPATECTPGAEVAQPTASFVADPTSGPAPLTVSVDGSASFDTDGSVVSYAWDFGNGQTATGPTASVQYADPGEYTISLTVTDDEGLTGVAVRTITVTEPTTGDGPTVSLGNASGLERDAQNGSVFVPVFLSEASDAPTTVVFHTVDGTAVAGADYVRWGTPATPRSITIPAGSLQGTINVPVTPDELTEPDEEFTVQVTSVSDNATLGVSTGTATIVDADRPDVTGPVLTVSSGTVREGDDGQRRAQFMVHLSRPLAAPLAIEYTTADGTAVAGEDYVTKLPGRTTMVPGQVSKTIDVLVNSDVASSGDRDFVLQVAVASGPPVTAVELVGTSTILDDD